MLNSPYRSIYISGLPGSCAGSVIDVAAGFWRTSNIIEEDLKTFISRKEHTSLTFITLTTLQSKTLHDLVKKYGWKPVAEGPGMHGNGYSVIVYVRNNKEKVPTAEVPVNHAPIPRDKFGRFIKINK